MATWKKLLVDPKSTAGILLREHDNIQQAINYAVRKAKMLETMHNAICIDYYTAAEDLREEQRRNDNTPGANAPVIKEK